MFKDHFKNFDEAYKEKFFQIGFEQVKKEEVNKYKGASGQAKLTYLSMSKKSRKKLQNSYFKEKLNC